jgi:hypothetical protein
VGKREGTERGREEERRQGGEGERGRSKTRREKEDR